MEYTYALTSSATSIERSDGAIIPTDPGNREYQEYLAWLAAGNTPEPYTPPPPTVPALISDRQFFQQAAILGLISTTEALDAVKTGSIPAALQSVVGGISDPDQKFAAEMLLSGATAFERNHSLTEAVGASLGWTSEQIDQFFISAAGL